MSLSPLKKLSVGISLLAGGSLVLWLCNNDGYHYTILLSLSQVAVIFGVVVIGQALAPRTISDSLSGHRENFSTFDRSIQVVLILWIALWMALGIGLLWVMPIMARSAMSCTHQTAGTIIARGTSSSKGGNVQWAVYEYMVHGKVIQSATQDQEHRYKTADAIRVCYNTFWPRHGHIVAVTPHHGISDPHP